MPPSTAPPSPSSPEAVGRRRAQFDRRTLAFSALVLFGALVAGIVLLSVFADPGSEPQPTTTASGTPHIIDRPNSGKQPTEPGDRGGAEQLLLFGGMVVAIGGIGILALRGGAGAKANRARWKAAGESGHDGALET
jgi:hypothetical protein